MEYLLPIPPANTSELVKRAYTHGLARIAVGLTLCDLRQLQAGVKRGDLIYERDLNMPGHWWHWYPIITIQEDMT